MILNLEASFMNETRLALTLCLNSKIGEKTNKEKEGKEKGWVGRECTLFFPRQTP